MQRNFQIIGVVILIALAGVTLFKLYQEPVSDQIISMSSWPTLSSKDCAALIIS